MKKAQEVNDELFWWIGLHKDSNSAQFVWNSTNQTQSLVDSWAGGQPATISMEEESCAGFDSSLAIQSEDCGEKALHSAICQFGKCRCYE